jgi:SAM-dependent methyltransferase
MIDRALLKKMRRDWDARAKENARHYVATGERDWKDDDFFRSGAESVRLYVGDHLDDICNGRDPASLKALEIGCGAGRMTLPLSRLFGHVDAVDVSAEMIAQARKALHRCTNVGLYLNNGADLSMFPDERFDFAISVIVFQHIPRRAIVENYVRETHRVLRSRSMFKFQVQGCSIPEDQAGTWVGVGFSEEQIQKLAEAAGFEIKASEGAGTQYYWLTLVKP